MAMKVFSFLYLNLALVCVSMGEPRSKHLNDHDKVGISNARTSKLVQRALLGLRKIALTGDQKLGYPILDPYKVDYPSWNYDDEDSGTKLDLTFDGPIVVKGLSEFRVRPFNIEADFKALRFFVALECSLRIEVPYKIDGFFTHLFPVFGEGVAKLKTDRFYFSPNMEFSLSNSSLVLDTVRASAYLEPSTVEVNIPDFMDFPIAFSEHIARDYIKEFVNNRLPKITPKLFQSAMEEIFGGKTVDEAVEFLNYLAEKAD